DVHASASGIEKPAVETFGKIKLTEHERESLIKPLSESIDVSEISGDDAINTTLKKLAEENGISLDDPRENNQNKISKQNLAKEKIILRDPDLINLKNFLKDKPKVSLSDSIEK